MKTVTVSATPTTATPTTATPSLMCVQSVPATYEVETKTITVSATLTTTTPSLVDVQSVPATCEVETKTITVSATLTTTTPSLVSVQSVPATCEVETKTITVSATLTTTTPSSYVQCTQAVYKTQPQIITVQHTFTTTVVVSQTPNDSSLDQGLKGEGSTMAWMVVAILFLITTISAIVLSTIMGYLLHKKGKTLEVSSAVASGSATKESAQGGTVSHSFSLF